MSEFMISWIRQNTKHNPHQVSLFCSDQCTYRTSLLPWTPTRASLSHWLVIVNSINEWMNEWIYSLDKITVSQAGTPRHGNCMRLPVSWNPINNWLRTIVKTSITNKSYLVIKHTKPHTLNITHEKQTPKRLVAIEFNRSYNVKISRGQLKTPFV